MRELIEHVLVDLGPRLFHRNTELPARRREMDPATMALARLALDEAGLLEPLQSLRDRGWLDPEPGHELAVGQPVLAPELSQQQLLPGVQAVLHEHRRDLPSNPAQDLEELEQPGVLDHGRRPYATTRTRSRSHPSHRPPSMSDSARQTAGGCDGAVSYGAGRSVFALKGVAG